MTITVQIMTTFGHRGFGFGMLVSHIGSFERAKSGKFGSHYRGIERYRLRCRAVSGGERLVSPEYSSALI